MRGVCTYCGVNIIGGGSGVCNPCKYANEKHFRSNVTGDVCSVCECFDPRAIQNRFGEVLCVQCRVDKGYRRKAMTVHPAATVQRKVVDLSKVAPEWRARIEEMLKMAEEDAAE